MQELKDNIENIIFRRTFKGIIIQRKKGKDKPMKGMVANIVKALLGIKKLSQSS